MQNGYSRDMEQEGRDQIEVYVKGTKKEIGWVTLPLSSKHMDRLTKEATGTEHGKDYFIQDYSCAYFEISKYEDLEVLNQVADMIERLNREERIQLKGWCNMHESGMTDLVEIGNAALQIKEGKIDYLHDITTEEELGDYLLEEAGIRTILQEKMRDNLDLDGDYIDCERVGRDFDINNESGYYVTDLWSKNRIAGYIRSDNEIDEFEYNQEELLALNLDAEMGRRLQLDEIEQEQEINAMKACMKRTADRSVQFREPELEK